MQLIIAEKPSVARDLARALPGKFAEREGYWEGPEHLVTWAVGHLLELAQPEDYDPDLRNWSLGRLPIIPEEFERRPRQGQTKQLRLIKKLAQRDDVDGIVNACDAAREGELIFREIIDWVGVDKPVQRLWLQSMTLDAIRESFRDMEPAEAFAGLGDSAYSRAEADWLIGMNATRAITKRLKGRRERGVWSAGRVQTPTLALLVHRELRVLAHEPKPFWRLKGSFEVDGDRYEGQYRRARSGKDVEKLWEREEAERIAEACRGRSAEVEEKASRSQRAVPPLHSLTSLQKEANNRFGLSARRTLAAAQRLYEGHKVLTYPRTDSACLPEDYRPKVQEVIGGIAGGDFDGAFSEKERRAALSEAAGILQRDGLRNEKRNFDDGGVSDHFAIIPTGAAPASPLGGDDAKVFELVTRRFLAAFLGPSTWEKVVRTTAVADAGDPQRGPYLFYTESSRLVEPGWQLVDRRPPASEQIGRLPGHEGNLAVPGQVREIEVEEDATRPPKRYTEAGLLKAMETASDVDLDEHDELDDEEVVQALKDKGLGTPATRAEIIESLVNKGYVLRSGKSLRPSAKGITLIDFLERLRANALAQAELTAEMEFHLHQVQTGARARPDYMKEVEDSVRELVEMLRDFEYEDLYADEEPVGRCPFDGAPVLEGLKGYRCSRESRGDRYRLTLSSAGKEAPLQLGDAVELVQDAVRKLPGVTGTEVDVKRVNAHLTVRFDESHLVKEVLPRLEQAGSGAVPEGTFKAVSAAPVEPDACNYTIWKEFRGRYVNRSVARKLLEERDSGPLEGFVSMRGETYAGRIRLDDEHKLAFEPVKDYKGVDEGGVAPELVSYPVDESPYVPCPMGKGDIVETPTHFESSEQGGIKMPRTVCKREMTRDDLRPYFDPEVGHTEWIEDFISRKGRPFTARLVRRKNGRHTFEFKPREGGGRKRKASPKKAKRKASPKKAGRQTGGKSGGG